MIVDAYSHVWPEPLLDAVSERHPSAEVAALRKNSYLFRRRAPAVPAGAERYVFKKFRGRAIDWAVAGVGAVTTAAATTGVGVLGGAGEHGTAWLAAKGTEPPSDLNASAGLRRHLARVLTAGAPAELGVAA